MHHAYVDRVYGEWQNRGGGNSFTGEHGGVAVNAQTVMVPFGRQAGAILTGISQCVSYVGGGGTVSRQVQIGAVTRQSGRTPGGSGSIIAKMTKDMKRDLQLAISRKKVDNAAAYKEELRVAVEENNAAKSAAQRFGVSAENIDAYERTQAVICLGKGIDISEPEVIGEDEAQVAAEGAQEVDAYLTGNDSALKPSKKSEAIAATVQTA